jgi:hypothetical protein
MAKCVPTEKAKQIIRAMAKAQLEAGLTSTDDILDAIHAAIADFAPMDKAELADIVSGFGQVRKATKTELQERLSQLKRDLRETYHPTIDKQPKPPKAPGAEDAAHNLARQKSIQKQIDKITEQLRTGDFTKDVPRRLKQPYDKETQRLQADLERARGEADRALRKIEYQAESVLFRGMTFAQSLMRASILSSPTVFAHLAGASAWRLFSTVLEDAVGSGLRFMPGIRDIDRMAMVEGGGFGARSHAAGLGGAFSKDTVRDIKDKLVRGMSDRQALYGRKGEHESNYPMLELFGHMHDAIKTPIENYAFARANFRVNQNMRAKLARQGMNPDEIDRAMVTDSMQSLVNGLAYAESQAAKLQGENKFVDWVNQGLRTLDKHGGTAGQVASAALRFQMPIMKIPTNMVVEIGSYGVGTLKAVETYLRTGRGASMTPAQADYFMRNLKKGTVGPVLFGLGWMAYENMGGMYREGHKPPNKDLGYGDMQIGDTEVNHHWTHSPFVGVIQAGALAHYAFDEDRAKEGSVLGSTLDGAFQATGALVNDLPFIEGPKTLLEATEGGRRTEKFFGTSARQFIPGAVQWTARQMDSDAEGHPNPRKPQNFTDELKVGIPGLREEVPEKTPPRLRKHRTAVD